MNHNKGFNLGKAIITPTDDVVAGSYGTWTLTLTIGTHGIDDAGHIRVAWRATGDWKHPQFNDPQAPNYATVTTTGDAQLNVKFDHGYIRPWWTCITIEVYDGYLAEGDEVTIVYGDTARGSSGSMAQTLVEESFEFKVLVDPFGTNQYQILPNPPTLRIIAGEPKRIVVINPSEAIIGEPTWVVVKIEDKWGNPSNYTETISFNSTDSKASLPSPYTFQVKDKGTHRFEGIIFQETGVQSITITEKNEMEITNNPVKVYKEKQNLTLYWGDIHGQTEETVGIGTLKQYFDYARDAAALDFTSHAGNDFQITKEHYADIQEIVKKFHIPGRFITFLGYEWSGLTPAGGDHNVYFLHDDEPIHRSSHTQVHDKTDIETDRYPLTRLFETFKGRDDVIIIPHIGGRHANLDYYDPSLTPFIEIASVHGHFEWFARDAMERGLKVGFVGSSDNHSCRPGATRPTLMMSAVRGGLMGIYAEELTREALWDAFRKRHVYATTGARIMLRVTCENAIMGDELAISHPPTFSISAVGVTGIEKIEIIKGVDIIHTHYTVDQSKVVEGAIKIVWSGARVKTRRRNTDWNGYLTIENGKILSVEEFAFDLPWHGITERTEKSVSWHSTTSGDSDGIILYLETSNETTVSFITEPAEFSFKLSELNEPIIVEAGRLEQKVTVSKIPSEKYPTEVNFEYKDLSVKSGITPYYVKLTQSNGEKAWSSPIFVNYK
ncbi:MAG: DUF3604 domain-containing protein [Candidatus Kariarchaeaceae archaeon]